MIQIRPYEPADAARLEEIRYTAFAPVFESIHDILGDELYDLAQAPDTAAHPAYLESLLKEDSGWDVYVAEADGGIAGFVSVQCNAETKVGEIGLNAVDPSYASRGIGTAMYEFALQRMRSAGMHAATVGTGGDPSHAPARRAYEKAGFTRGVPSVWLCRKL